MKILILLLFLNTGYSYGQQADRASLENFQGEMSRSLSRGDFKSAIRHAETALDISKKMYGSDDRQLAIAYDNLGVVLSASGKYKLAVGPLRTALEIFRKDPNRNGIDIVRSMQKVGDSLALSGDRKEAETVFADAVKYASTQFGDESREAINTKAMQGCFYLASNKDRAFRQFGESYALAVKNFGIESPELDEVVTVCEGSFIRDFWKDERFPNLARKRINELLVYELGKPVGAKRADYSLRMSDIGRPNLTISSAIVKVWVNHMGTVTAAKLLLGPGRFTELSISAAWSTRFKPSVRNGKPVPDVMFVEYSFIR